MDYKMTPEQVAKVNAFFNTPSQQIPIPYDRWDNAWFRLLSDPGVLKTILPDSANDIRRVRWADSEVPCDINLQRLPFGLLCVDRAGTLHVSFYAETTNWLGYRAFKFGLQYAERLNTREEPIHTAFDMCDVAVLDPGGELPGEKLQFSLCHQTPVMHFNWSYDFRVVGMPATFSAYRVAGKRASAQELYSKLGCTQEERLHDCELLMNPKSWTVRGK